MSTTSSVYDFHIHTEYSPDSSTPMSDYARLADQLSIHIGFLDHFELAFVTRPGYLNFQTIPMLLETFDRTKSEYPRCFLGLEVDYYSDRAEEVAEFCENYRNDFDYFIGTIHTIENLAVTTKEELDVLVSRIGLPTIIHRYFTEVEEAIRSNLFDGIAHLDGVMRFVPLYPHDQKVIDFWHRRTLELGRLCQQLDVLIEINLRGQRHPWGRLHPSQPIISELIKAEARFFVGSDSHSLNDFKQVAPRLCEFHRYLRDSDALGLPVVR
ncbi:MAG: PHP domain-containing protein [Promethearchaeota archaeon]